MKLEVCQKTLGGAKSSVQKEARKAAGLIRKLKVPRKNGFLFRIPSFHCCPTIIFSVFYLTPKNQTCAPLKQYLQYAGEMKSKCDMYNLMRWTIWIGFLAQFMSGRLFFRFHSIKTGNFYQFSELLENSKKYF